MKIPPTTHYRCTARKNRNEFMWHLYSQGFTAKEIGEVYNIPHRSVESIFYSDRKKVEREKNL